MFRIGIFVVLTASALLAEVPPWMREAAREPLPAYAPEVHGVVLLDEQSTTIDERGEVRTLHRRVSKVLRTAGRGLGTVTIPFDSETKISHLRAWSIPAQGAEYEIKDKDVIESSTFEGLYSDNRIKVLQIPAAEPGSIVGYEYEQKQRPYILQDLWSFQGSLPRRKVRYSLRMPPGWEYSAVWKNYGNAEPSAGSGYVTWELTDIPAIKTEEEYRPHEDALAGMMAVSFFSPTTTSFKSWNDIGRWYGQLTVDRRQASPVLQQKVRQLTEGKSTSLEKIKALAAFAQRDVRYVGIWIGIGGHRPHTASEVFANRYGDCKDKATVLAAMLNEIGVKSYYVLTDTRRGYLSKAFPTPWMNHAVIAVALPIDSAEMPAVYKHPTLGRLLIFDPTDSITPLGLAPAYLQGGHGLLVTEQGGDFIDIPLHSPDTNQLNRTAKLTLSTDGSLTGEVREIRSGEEAREKRSELLAVPVADRERIVNSFLSSFLVEARFKDLKVENLEDFEKELIIQYKIEAANYSRVMGSLVLVRPRVMGGKGLGVDYKDRKYPIELDAVALHKDEFEIVMPAEFTIDELPPAARANGSPVSYWSETSFKDGALKYRREYRVADVRVPLEAMRDFRSVMSQIAADERNSAVLKRTQ